MEHSAKEQTLGMFDKVKGKIMALFGKASNNTGFEREAKDEEVAGNIQQNVGGVEKTSGE